METFEGSLDNGAIITAAQAQVVGHRFAASSPGGMYLAVHDPHRPDAALIDAWDRLAKVAIEPNPYLESWHLLPAIHLFDRDRRARLFALWQDDGALAGIIALTPAPRYGRFPLDHASNWLHANCFLGTPLIRKGAAHAFWTQLLDALDASDWAHNLLYMSGLTAGGPVHAALLDVVRKTGRSCDIVHSESRALIETDLSPDHYWERALTGKKRKELRRQFARLGELGTLRFEKLAADGDAIAWSDAFLALEQTGWKGKAGSALASSKDTRELFYAVMNAGHQRGQLDALALLLDDRPIAMLVHFISGNGGFSYKTAYDETLARYSPGVLLQRENLALLETRSLDWIDSCASADHPMINHIWRERREIIRLAVTIGGFKDRLMFNGVRSLEKLRAWSKRRHSVREA